jgi:CheY-like chemotaxis protein
MADTSKVVFPDPQERVPTILVAEDEVLIRFVIADYLRDCGFQVIEASSGDEAVSILESTVSVDLVFTDVQMPGSRDGFELAQWVRANRPGVPVLLTSGDSKKAATAKQLCENEPFFAKPYEVAHVVAHIRQHLETRKSET